MAIQIQSALNDLVYLLACRMFFQIPRGRKSFIYHNNSNY